MQRRSVRKILVREQNGRCFYCGRRISLKSKKKSKRMTIDHYIPKSKGGEDRAINMVAACAKCNHAKANTMPEKPLEK